MRKQLNKVFPDHWSFMMGEIALYSFIILLLTGTYLTFFFDPSYREVTYHGAYEPLQGQRMSAAYASAVNLSFEYKAGLLMRQTHHWAANVFIASITIHLFLVFFTVAFRKPRLGSRHTQCRHQSGLARILARRLAHDGCVAVRIEQVVGDLECGAEAFAITDERPALLGRGAAQDAARLAGEADEGAGLHGLQA